MLVSWGRCEESVPKRAPHPHRKEEVSMSRSPSKGLPAVVLSALALAFFATGAAAGGRALRRNPLLLLV